MEIFRDLPYDLQCLVVKKMDAMERVRLSWCPRLTISCTHRCTYIHEALGAHLFDMEEMEEHEFTLYATFECDRNGVMWMNTRVDWMFWFNSINCFKNVPICRANRKSPKDIGRLMKRAFFEYMRYTHVYSSPVFKNRRSSSYELTSVIDGNKHIVWEGDRLSIDGVTKWIRSEWFSGGLSDGQEKAKEKPLIPNFSINDELGALLGFIVRRVDVPYRYEDLLLLQEHCPVIYKCLEEFGELKSPLFDPQNPIRQYIRWHKKLATEEREAAIQHLTTLLDEKITMWYDEVEFPSIDEMLRYASAYYLVK